MLVKPDQLESLSYFSALIIGKYKTGKTESVWTYRQLRERLHMKAKKLYVFDFDMGAAPLVRRARLGGWLDDLKIYRYAQAGGARMNVDLPTPHSKDPILDWMKDINALYDQVDPNTGYWKDSFLPDAPAVILTDSLTSFGEVALDFTIACLGHEIGAPGHHGGSDYGKQMAKIVESVKSTRALPCVSIWTAHEAVEVESVGQPGGLEQTKPIITGERFILPVVTGKLAGTIGALFDVVVYTKVEGDTYSWKVKPQGDVKGAGSRLKGKFDTATIAQDLALLV